MTLLQSVLRVLVVFQAVYLLGAVLAVIRLYWRNPPFQMHVIPTAVSYLGLALLVLHRLYEYPDSYNPTWRLLLSIALFALGDIGVWLMVGQGEKRMRQMRDLSRRVQVLEDGGGQ